MDSYRVPLELDLGAFPARSAEVAVEVDLPQVAAHTGSGTAPALGHVVARLADGREFPAQLTAGGLMLVLPADVAAADAATVFLTLTDEKAAKPAGARVIFNQGPDSVTILVDGVNWATYRYNTADPELPRPYFHPILSATGAPITQDGEFPGTTKGHIWHTGLVIAHQNFTDGNNWQTGSPNYSRIRHLAFDVMQSGPVLGRFTQRLEWPSFKGDRVVFRELRTVTVPAREAATRCIDVDTTITCGEQPATWNATPYHLLAIRVPDAMLVGKGGAITTSEGDINPKDGTVARWLDYSGPLEGGACGVAILNHPKNPRHPTPWLNFNNQTVGAAPTHREPYAWKPGESLRFRYRVYFHSGDVRQGKVAEEYASFAAEAGARIGPPTLVPVA